MERQTERGDSKERKTGGRRLHAALTAAKVRTVTEPGRYFDGLGLFLLVEPSGAKRWKQRLTVQGRRQELGLGPYPVVTLAMAREAAIQHRRDVRAGENPKTRRLRERGMPTFAEAARKVYELRRPGWRNTKHAHQWIATLEKFVFPPIGTRAIDDVTADDVLGVLSPIWHSKPTTAKRVRQRIGAVLTWAVAQGLRPDNPADSVMAVLPHHSGASTPQRALPYAAVAAALTMVRASANAFATVKLAFEFLVFTAARSGEVRGARWDEIDFDARTWTVSASRMKANREHRVPLSESAVEVLNEARALGDGHEFVFASRRGRALSETALPRLMTRLGIDAVPHGFRSSFREWAAECTNIPREVCEAALAHVNPNRVEAAYQRSKLFDKRRDLMERWARYLNPEPAAVLSLAARKVSRPEGLP